MLTRKVALQMKADNKTYLQLKDLSCGYHNKPVLSGISLDIPTGEVLCILGRNGIGKTTLFRTLLGSLAPLSGTVMLGLRNLFELTRRERAERIAYVPQTHNPPFAFTVFDSVLMGRTGHASAFSAPSAQDRKLATEALECLGIAHLSQRAYTKVSGGERQMVLIARALCQGSDFLFLDEPATSLDVANQTRVLGILRDLAMAGKGVVFTSHDPNHALALGARVAAIKPDGKLVCGEAANVLTAEMAQALYGVRAEIVDVHDAKGGRDVKTFTSFLD